MTDYPRFEPVKGDIETAHKHHHGGALVDLVFKAIDRLGAAGDLRPKASIEIHERPQPASPSGGHVASRTIAEPEAAHDKALHEGCASPDFLCGSARTRRLQIGSLAAIALIATALLVQTATSSQQTRVDRAPAPVATFHRTEPLAAPATLPELFAHVP